MAAVAALLLALFVLPSGWRVPVVLVGLAVEVGEAAFWWRLSRRRRPVVGLETLVGRPAAVTATCRPIGQVRLNGELWRASCARGADPGDRVRVVSVAGLTMVVEPEGGPGE